MLATELAMSASEVHASVKRATRAGLFKESSRTVNRHALLEFLVHAVKYIFPAERGGITRGLPTCHAAPPLNRHFRPSAELPPVWPDPDGTVRGEELEPLYRSVPKAARADAQLYEWLVLVGRGGVRGAHENGSLPSRSLRSRLS